MSGLVSEEVRFSTCCRHGIVNAVFPYHVYDIVFGNRFRIPLYPQDVTVTLFGPQPSGMNGPG